MYALDQPMIFDIFKNEMYDQKTQGKSWNGGDLSWSECGNPENRTEKLTLVTDYEATLFELFLMIVIGLAQVDNFTFDQK